MENISVHLHQDSGNFLGISLLFSIIFLQDVAACHPFDLELVWKFTMVNIKLVCDFEVKKILVQLHL